VSAENILALIEDCAGKSTLGDFSQYLAKMCGRGQKKWMIFSDYVLDDDTKPNDVFAFTVFPYFVHFDDLKGAFATAAPRDIKKTREVTAEMIRAMRSEWLFNWAFVFSGRYRLFGSNAVDERKNLVSGLDVASRMVKDWQSNVQNPPSSWKHFLEKLEAMKQELQKNSPNMKLMRSICLTAIFGGYIMYLVIKHAQPEIVGWFSDRDNILSYCDGIVFDLLGSNQHGLCERDGISRSAKIIIATPDAQGPNWYDEMLRVPDYLAGTLADWNRSTNDISKEKFVKIVEDVLADNRNLSIFEFKLNAAQWTCGRVAIEKR